MPIWRIFCIPFSSGIWQEYTPWLAADSEKPFFIARVVKLYINDPLCRPTSNASVELNVMSLPAGEIQRPMWDCSDAEWQFIVPICPDESAISALLFEIGWDVPHKPAPANVWEQRLAGIGQRTHIHIHRGLCSSCAWDCPTTSYNRICTCMIICLFWVPSLTIFKHPL